MARRGARGRRTGCRGRRRPNRRTGRPDDVSVYRGAVLQLGDLPKLSAVEPVRVLWQAPNEPEARWSVDVRQSDNEPWRTAVGAGARLIAQPNEPYRLFNVPLTRLRPGAEFDTGSERTAR